jgi:predicted 2-oxoglutarate/Fe(II)-dependent dioxygenase YbiX
MSDTSKGLRPGDRLPFCYGMDSAQRYWSFEDQAGAPSVLVCAGAEPPSAVAALADAFAARAAAFQAYGAQVRLLARVGAPGWATATPPPELELAHVMTSDLFDAAAAGPVVLVADRAMRLVAQFSGRLEDATVDAALAALDRLAHEPAREVTAPAPVLIVPRLLEADACARLIARFEGGDHVEGAMASVDAEGAAIRRIDAAKKRRRDLALDPAEPLHAEVTAALANRLAPEIAKAFQVQVAHLDRILVARYDDAGGYFRRHRDNSSAHLAYREFAVSVNLNTGDYTGGELLFPEYNDHRHNPPAGAALAFSASLLHEAAPVRLGSRYVLLTFLHSDAAEARRQAALAETIAG